MKILTLRAFRKDNSIVIATDTISIKETRLMIDAVLFLRHKTILETMLDKFVYTDPKKVELALKRDEGPRHQFRCLLDKRNTTGNSGASTYELPPDPTLALDFLAALESFINASDFSHVQLVDFSFNERLQKNAEGQHLPESVEDFVKLGHRMTTEDSAANLLAECIRHLPSIPSEYKYVIEAINKICDYAAKSPTDFASCLELKLRYKILFSTLEKNIPLNTSFLEDNMKFLYALERKYIREGRREELNHLIDNLNLRAKIELYEIALGKKADDGGTYKYSYTEWSLLKHAQFSVRSDGRVTIKLKNNPGYQEHYASGKRLDGKLEKEFRFLANVIGLEFSDDTNFDDELIFTPACSKKLLATGLHHNRDYLKKLLKAKNTITLFAQGKRNESDKSNNYSYFFRLPKDIIEIIFGYSYADLQRGLDIKEVTETTNISWAKKEKECEERFTRPTIKL